MAQPVYDITMLSTILSEVEQSLLASRDKLDKIVSDNQNIDSFSDLSKGESLMKAYGKASDDYVKVCFIATQVAETTLDMRTARKMLTSGETKVPQSLVKSYKFRIDSVIEQLTIYREAVQSAKQGIEARVRYYNSCSYTSYDKVIGAKC